jgi:hypothetical protein
MILFFAVFFCLAMLASSGKVRVPGPDCRKCPGGKAWLHPEIKVFLRHFYVSDTDYPTKKARGNIRRKEDLHPGNCPEKGFPCKEFPCRKLPGRRFPRREVFLAMENAYPGGPNSINIPLCTAMQHSEAKKQIIPGRKASCRECPGGKACLHLEINCF